MWKVTKNPEEMKDEATRLMWDFLWGGEQSNSNGKNLVYCDANAMFKDAKFI